MFTKASAQIVIGSYFVPRVLVQLQVFMQAQRRKKFPSSAIRQWIWWAAADGLHTMRSWKIPSWTSPACSSLKESPRPPVESYSLSRETITTKSVLDYYAFVLHALGFHSNQARRTHDCHHMPVVTDSVCLIPRLVYMRAAARYRIAPLWFILVCRDVVGRLFVRRRLWLEIELIVPATVQIYILLH
jgi:hypothetical protein